jgi:hypothetical protein
MTVDQTLQELKTAMGRLPSTDEALGFLGLSRTEPHQLSLSSLGAFTMGIALGAALGLLFAPRTGQELRAQLGEQASELASDVGRRLQRADASRPS